MRDCERARADAAAAPRRRGPVVLRRGGPPHRRARDQGRAGVRPGRRPRRSSASTSTSTCSTRARATPGAAGLRGGTGETFDWALLAGARSKVPLILSGGLDAGERRRGDRRGAPLRGRHRQRHRGGARAQGPRASCGRSSPRSAARAARSRRGDAEHRRRAAGVTRVSAARAPEPVEHRFGPYGGQFVPETLMPALAELEQAWIASARATRPTAPSSTGCCATSAGARRRSTAPAALRARRAARVPQARGPQPHRLAQAQQRARPGAARQADGQAADHRRDRRRPARRRDRDRLRAARTWSASSTWASRTRAASGPTCSAWSCSARRVQPVDAGRADAEGGDLGGDPRLGDERRRAPTT